jgi:thiosulfate dehydrogenase [quinone] large subunit
MAFSRAPSPARWPTRRIARPPTPLDLPRRRAASGADGWRERTAVLDRLRAWARQPGLALLPARVFIGVGWLRACSEKLADPGWFGGASLEGFLSRQLAEGAVVFPLYERAIVDLFLPQAAVLAVVIAVGQFLAGVSILVGGFTTAALLGALFMNVNFLLAGAPNPSAFYLVVQAVLLAGGAGAAVGVDADLSRVIRNPWLVAQPAGRGRMGEAGRGVLAALALVCLTASLLALLQAEDRSAAGSVDDPAMVAAMLAGLGAVWAAVGWLRADPPAHARPDPNSRGRLFDLDAALAGAPLAPPRPPGSDRRQPDYPPPGDWPPTTARAISRSGPGGLVSDAPVPKTVLVRDRATAVWPPLPSDSPAPTRDQRRGSALRQGVRQS